jgi:hypothetical protein
VSGSSTAEIFYVTFGAETYTPVTRSNIEDENSRYGEVNVEDPDFKRLMMILSRAQGGHGCFNPKWVRLKIRTRDSVMYVDGAGVVERSSSLGFLSETELKTVQRLVEFDALTDVRTAPRPAPRLAPEELETCN